MRSSFEADPHPSQPRILFVGAAYSSHTHAWIDLLKGADFNVRLFTVPDGGCPPADWLVPTYLTGPWVPAGLDPATRSSLYATPEEAQRVHRRKLARNPVYLARALTRKARATLRGGSHAPVDGAPQPPQPRPVRATSAQAWLAEILRAWQPDIVHTLGLDPSGYFCLRVLKQMGQLRRGAWVLQLRGGSDLALTRFNQEKSRLIADVFRECDQVLTDNWQNFTYVCELGGRPEQLASINPVPGTGGVDVRALRQTWRGPTSSRRMILWPKSYECPWSKALPVLEAIRAAWSAIQPCEIAALTMPPEVEMWLKALPDEIRRAVQVFQGIPRPKVLELLAGSRVMLAPSLVDGVPNSLYEAMALGAFPVVSPLETIAAVVRNEANVLFARNLYPDEIAGALVRAMKDDLLVDLASERNLALVEATANRELIAPRVIRFYEALADSSSQPREGRAP
jgi:hypothetical protein